jgi:serine/threonine-protein kinase
MGILTQHMYKAPVPIRALVPAPDCPPSLEAVILKCLSKKPEARYASMDELSADLGRVRSGGVPLAVGEMMARSGGFNVPHDYFKTPGVILPATPRAARKSWPTVVWIAGALAAMVLVAAIFTVAGLGAAKDKPAPAATAAAPATVAAPVTAAPSATAAAPAVKKTTVALAASPKNAQAFRDGVAITLPAIVEVEDGKPIQIELKAPGYEPATISIDGTEASKLVELRPLRGAPVRPPPGKGGKKTTGGDVVDPWAH